MVATPAVTSRSHVCWLFDGHDSFRRAAVEFLAAGALRGDLLLYATREGRTDDVVEDLAEAPKVARRVTARSLVPSSTRELYAPDGTFDRDRQLARYEQLTVSAVREGFAGLSVVTEATSLVPDDPARAAAVEYELAVDALANRLPVSALCAYDAEVLGGAAAAQLCMVHPQRRAGPAADCGFSLFHDRGVLRLAGEIDAANHHLAAVAFRAAVATTTRTDVAIDLADLTFIDVPGLQELALLARRLTAGGRQLTLVQVPSAVQRACMLLGDDGLGRAVERGRRAQQTVERSPHVQG